MAFWRFNAPLVIPGDPEVTFCPNDAHCSVLVLSLKTLCGTKKIKHIDGRRFHFQTECLHMPVNTKGRVATAISVEARLYAEAMQGRHTTNYFVFKSERST